MDLSLTKRAEYVLRAAISLAKHADEPGYRKIREVSEEMDLPPRYTPQILNLLLKAGLAEARAGQRGGYRLLRSAHEISLLEIIEAAEGPLCNQACPLHGVTEEPGSGCGLYQTWLGAQDALIVAL